MPPISGANYLVGYFFEVGPTMAAGMGDGPVTFGEILAWAALTGVVLTCWDARALRSLSRIYLAEAHRATKLGTNSRWEQPEAKPEPTSLQLSLRALAADK